MKKDPTEIINPLVLCLSIFFVSMFMLIVVKIQPPTPSQAANPSDASEPSKAAETPGLVTPVAMESIPSDNCIACHTDSSTIASLAVVEEAGGHGGEGS